MICKWCGETVKSGDKTCRRCRREVSPLSDCGGFYDLVPQARNAAAPAAPSYDAPVKDAPAPRSGQVPVKPVLPEKKNSSVNIITVVALALAVIFLVLTVTFSGKLKAAQAQIQELQKELDEAEENTVPEDPTSPIKDRPNVGGDEDPDADPDKDPVEDAVLEATFVEGQLMVSFNEEGNLALRSGKTVKVVCSDDKDNVICTLVFTSVKTDDEVCVTVEVQSGWDDVYFQWSDPEDPDRPMTWEQTGGDMFTPENEVDGEDDGKSGAAKDKDDKQETAEIAPQCTMTAKLAEEPFFVLCSISAQDGEFNMMIYNIMIG